jgi:Holliday junction resolvasome RuvABC ATP-dependent DNA helicase subunit
LYSAMEDFKIDIMIESGQMRELCSLILIHSLW